MLRARYVALKDVGRLRRAPEDADPRVNRAETLIRMKRFADAIDSATDALRLNPDHFSAFMARAHARLGMGDGEGALADYQSARRISGNRFLSNIEDRANLVTGAQKAMTRESVASMEADRQTILAAVEGHLHDKCGHYRVPDYQDNENLNAYRDCVLAWSKAEDGELGRAIGAAIEQPVNRHYESRKWISVASDLRCSKMPKKSRCVDDTLYTRAEATVAGMDDPRILIGNAEWDRLNREVDVYNARLARADKVEKYVSFMQALSDALAEQSSQ